MDYYCIPGIYFMFTYMRASGSIHKVKYHFKVKIIRTPISLSILDVSVLVLFKKKKKLAPGRNARPFLLHKCDRQAWWSLEVSCFMYLAQILMNWSKSDPINENRCNLEVTNNMSLLFKFHFISRYSHDVGQPQETVSRTRFPEETVPAHFLGRLLPL